MPVFDLKEQNSNLESRITAGLERLGHAFRVMLWEKAAAQNVGPAQIQLMIFIKYHQGHKSTVSYLASEFGMSKATISDAIKSLRQKKLIASIKDEKDARSYTLQLTTKGKAALRASENFADPLKEIISQLSKGDKLTLWKKINGLILELHKSGYIQVQRTCGLCRHYSRQNGHAYCSLLRQKLKPADIRLDCPEFDAA